MDAGGGTDRLRRALLSAGAGAALGGLLLWLVFRKSDGAALLGALRESNPAYVVLALGAGLAAVVAKAARWVVLLRGATRLPLRTSLAAVFVGTAGNALLSHLGEVPRIVMAARATGTGAGGLLASIVAERVLDLCAIAVLLAFLLIRIDGPGVAPPGLELLLGAAGLVAIVAVATVLWAGETVADRLDARLGPAVPRWRAKASSWLRQVLQAFRVFRSGSGLSLAVLLSLAIWALFAACIHCCLLATGIHAKFGNSLTVLGVNAAALVLPAPPGRVGTIQASFAVALASTPAGADRVLAASVIYNMLMTLPFWCIGGLAWWRHWRGADDAARATSRSRKP